MLCSGHFDPERTFFFLEMLMLLTWTKPPDSAHSEQLNKGGKITFYTYVIPVQKWPAKKNYLQVTLNTIFFPNIEFSLLATCVLSVSTGFVFLLGTDWSYRPH